MKLISSALVKAQRAFGTALKTSTNPHYSSQYADLAACIEAVYPALHDNGIAVMQPSQLCSDGVIVETLFIHESGESMSSGPLHVPAPKQDPQGYGSALTYARRYSLMAACGLAPEDDDGNAAMSDKKETPKNNQKKEAKKPPAQKPSTTCTKEQYTKLQDLCRESFGGSIDPLASIVQSVRKSDRLSYPEAEDLIMNWQLRLDEWEAKNMERSEVMDA